MQSEVQRFQSLDKLSTPELEKLLRDDERGKITLSIADIQCISELLLMREKQNPTVELPDPHVELNRMKASCTASEPGITAQDTAAETGTPKQDRKAHRYPVRKIAVTIAATVAIISIVVMPALGYESLLQILGQWTSEQFFFATSDDSSDLEENDSPHIPGTYDSIQEALDDYNITAVIVPSWIPNRFSLEEVDVDINIPVVGDISFYATYEAEDKALDFSYIFHATDSTLTYEKDSTDVQLYEVNGITHYIFFDQDWTSAAWYVDDLECSISGNITITEIKK
ncbi:MAG: DUF4367 domain-containing protein [Clostridiales bacterium]|nr:DUF4367 domain-containing protein [Clostridiales bacterium]